MDNKYFEDLDKAFDKVVHDYIETDVALNVAKGEAGYDADAYLLGMLKGEVGRLRDKYNFARNYIGGTDEV